MGVACIAEVDLLPFLLSSQVGSLGLTMARERESRMEDLWAPTWEQMAACHSSGGAQEERNF